MKDRVAIDVAQKRPKTKIEPSVSTTYRDFEGEDRQILRAAEKKIEFSEGRGGILIDKLV